jgi:hypothetical protein
VGCGK